MNGNQQADGYASAQAQFEQMFAAGAAQAIALQLHPGLSLSAAQVASLSSNVIMLEEREVDVPNTNGVGTTSKQKVLVPIVYLANIKPGDLQANGALIAASDINLANTQGFSNTGALVASNGLNIAMAAGVGAGAGLNNRGGTLQSGGLMALSTVNSNIDLTSAQLKAGSLNIDAGNKLILATAAQDRSNSFSAGGASGTRTQTDLGRIGSIDVTGSASIKTAGNFEQTGALLKVGGNLNADIGGSFVLGTVQRQDSLAASFAVKGASGTSNSTLIQNTLSGVQVGGSTVIKTGQDFTSQGANIALNRNGLGTSQITAGGNINLLAVKDTISVNAQSTSSGGGGLFGGGSASSTRQSMDETLRGSNLTSNNALTLTAGRNINVSASQIQAEGATSLSATGNVNITTEQEQHNSLATHNGSSSGFLSSKSSAERISNNASLAVGSSVGGSTVAITAGNNIDVKGSSFVSDTGTALTAGNNVTVQAGQTTQSNSSFREQKSSGLSSSGLSISFGSKAQSTDSQNQQTTASASTVGAVSGNVNISAGQTFRQVGSDVMAPAGDVNITAKAVEIIEARETSKTTTEQKQSQSGISIGISSPIVSAIQSAQSMAQAVGNTSDGRMQALGVAAGAFNLYNQAGAIGDAAKALSSGNPLGAGSINVSIGSSKSQSNSSSTSDTARGSSVSAGNNVNINATGAGVDSNLTVQGSSVAAGGSTNLFADNQVNLLAARNDSSQTSSNSSSSSSLGVSYGAGGFGFSVSASKGQGSGNGADTSFTNTNISAGNTATIQSGGDTALQGAVVAANTVKANVGGNLNVQSLQDASTYTSQQSSAGGSLSFGSGGVTGGGVSASKSNIDSNFASVGQQSGIKAGDGGFQVAVNNNTALAGGVIASTQAAVDNNKNTFTTGGNLSISEVQNTASFTGTAAGFSVDVGKQDGKFGVGGVGVGLGSDKGNAASTTTAGISGIAGNTSVRTGDAETGLQKIFDAQKVQREINAQVAITQAFSKEAPKAVATFAQTKYDELKTSNPEEAKKWAEGGTYRVALHTLAGAFSGGLNGAAGAAVSASAAPLMQQLQDGIAQSLQTAGMTTEAAKGIASGIAGLTAAGVGAALGGAQGAASAFTVDFNNRQLHPTERQRATELAANSKGRFTKEQIEEQMRLMGNIVFSEGPNKVEALITSESIAANIALDPAMPKTISGRVVMEVPGQVNLEIQRFIIASTQDGAGYIPGASPYSFSDPARNGPVITNAPPQTGNLTARCANGDIACASGVGAQQSAPLSAAQTSAIKENIAKQAQDLSRLAGVVSNAAAAVAPNAAGANLAVQAAIVGLGANAIEQTVAPDKGKLLVESAIDIGTKPLADRFPIISPIVNELAEYLKTLKATENAKDKVGK